MDGIINVYKEKGYTSHDVVARMRGILRMKKIGHTGTLDPEAEGVLPVCLGRATKVCDLLTDKTKTYRTVLLLGRETDTQDTTGTVLAERPVEVTGEQVEQAVLSFLGTYQQVPPMYSALKVNGKKLYELARAGREVERQPRPVEILSLRIEKMELPRVTMEVTCSKGTYIRTLCYDIGRKLGCGGCMESLVRTRVDRFRLEDSLRLDEIEALRDVGQLEEQILPVDQVFAELPALVMKAGEGDKRVHNGNPFPPGMARIAESAGGGEDPKTGGTVNDRETDTAGAGPRRTKDGPRYERARIYDSAGDFIGIYGYDGSRRQYRPWKLFLGGS